ncbi:hypothetical protein Q1695_000710 [Nippostrongylus brasiliensis]|nr:hypothetical protein Q1695_000710 [Nippostrongylus brasiliensis]
MCACHIFLLHVRMKRTSSLLFSMLLMVICSRSRDLVDDCALGLDSPSASSAFLSCAKTTGETLKCEECQSKLSESGVSEVQEAAYIECLQNADLCDGED